MRARLTPEADAPPLGEPGGPGVTTAGGSSVVAGRVADCEVQGAVAVALDEVQALVVVLEAHVVLTVVVTGVVEHEVLTVAGETEVVGGGVDVEVGVVLVDVLVELVVLVVASGVSRPPLTE